MYLMVFRLLVWLFGADDILRVSGAGTFLSHLAWALYRFGVVWLFYVALEPYLRRIWPRTMVSWTRLLEGRFRDPLVGRDILLGTGLWAGFLVLIRAIPLLAERLGIPRSNIEPDPAVLGALAGLSDTVWSMLYHHAQYLLDASLFMVIFLLILRVLLRKTWIALPVWNPCQVRRSRRSCKRCPGHGTSVLQSRPRFAVADAALCFSSPAFGAASRPRSAHFPEG
jgi:serine/threonine-protein kinase